MSGYSRADNTWLARWWLSVDRWTLGALCFLVGCGYIMALAASPAVAERIHASSRELFIGKQLVFLALSVAIIVSVSMLPARVVRLLAVAGCCLALLATVMTLVVGVETKGAQRWISIVGNRIQPSEFLKPCFALTTAWLLSRPRPFFGVRGVWVALGLLALIALLLKKQPDVGMMAVIGAVFLIQLYISGINILWIAACFVLAGGGGVALYSLLPHVRRRFDQFMYGKGGNYQIDKVMEAFSSGGLFGRGAGEGKVKDTIPDVHADVVFAVVGEEFGLVVCLLLIGVFAFIVLRGLLRLIKEQDMFVVLACTGLIAGFGLQAMVNLFSTLGMMPTKGMTLPFISYGGSSAVAVGLGMGMLLALTRPRSRIDLHREPLNRDSPGRDSQGRDSLGRDSQGRDALARDSLAREEPA